MTPASPMTALALRDRIISGELSAVEVCRAALARIERDDVAIHAFQSLMPERALARAEDIDRDPSRFRDKPLAGVPVAIKDNIATRGHVTTAGSRLLERFTPPYDADAVERLDAAGAVLIGKTTLDEFGMGSSTDFSAFGPARNPWAMDRTPGGSSGGSAAAVAAGFVPIALGSDTGGSIRQPAAFCGVTGLKPTYGRVSRFGLVAFASSLDQIGTFGRGVADAAAALQVIAGRDPRDATSADATPIAWQPGSPMARGTRIGVPSADLEMGVHPEVREAFERALDELVAAGATRVDIALPSSRAALAAYYLIATAEASSNLARFDGVRYGARVAADTLDQMYARTRTAGFGPEVRRRIMLGTYALSAGHYDEYYMQAQKVRARIRHEFEAAFEQADVLAMPSSPVPAFALGDRVADPLGMYYADVFTVGANLAGLPAIGVPCGFTSGDDGPMLPIGLQLIGAAWDEARMLTVAETYERRTSWLTRTPGAPA